MGSRRGATSHVLTPDENRRGGSATTPAKRQAAAQNGRAWLDQFRQTEDSKAATHLGGKAATAQRWICDDCGFLSHAPGVAIHQRSKDHHSGRTRVDTNTKENP